MIEDTTARRLLESALGGEPRLDEQQLVDLLELARNDAGEITGAGLDAAAARGWSWKAAIVAPLYDLGAGAGKTLDRSQWFAHCDRMIDRYKSGHFGARRRGGSIQLVSSVRGVS